MSLALGPAAVVGKSADLYDSSGYPPTDERALLTYQARWYYDRSKIKVAAKSRQVGITWTTALEAVEVGSLRASAGGMDVYFMSISQEDARQFIETCAEWIGWLTPLTDSLASAIEIQESEDWFEKEDGSRILAYRIDFPSGFSIYALPSRPARLRGKQGLAICDEAAQQDLEAWLTAAGGLLIWGGRLIFISTYDGVENDFYRLVENIRSGQQPGSLHEISIYDALADGLYRRICRSRPPYPTWSPEAESQWLEDLRGLYGSAFAEECEIVPRRGGGSLYARELVSACQILGPSECTIVEMKGGPEPRCWVNGDERGRTPNSWLSEVANVATPDDRALVMRAWLDANVSAALASITADGLPVHVGIDYGRSRNLTTIIIGVLRRDMTRRVRLIIELEKMPWPEQDAVQDYAWERLPNLAAGCTDGGGNGSNSSERASNKTGGKVRSVKINAGWHDPQFAAIEKRLQERSLQLPRHFGPIVDDLTSLRRVGAKIVAPQRLSKDGRKQRRHADSAYALALFEQSVVSDGPRPPTHQRRRAARPRRNRRIGR